MQKEFSILLRRQIPFLTRAIWLLLCVCFVILYLLWLIMYPARASHSSLDMQTAYYILVVPGWLKYLSGLAMLGSIILLPLYLMRIKTPSTLLILNDRFIISNKSVNVTLPFVKVKRVYVNDLTNYKGELKYKLQIVISYKRQKTLAFLLVNYEDTDELMQSLSVFLNPDKFSFYDKKMDAVEDAV